MASSRKNVVLESVQRLLRMGATGNLLKLLQKQHPADLAQIFRQLPGRQASSAFGVLVASNARLAMEAMAELEPGQAASMLAERPPEEIAQLLQELPPDDAAGLIDRLPEELAARVLDLMRRDGDVRSLLEHEEQTAGRLMNPNVFALAEDVTAGEAVATIQRSQGVELVFYLYVVDDRRHLIGVVSLRRLLLVAPDTPLRQIMTTDPIRARVDTDQEEVARLVASYNLLAIPVVDEENKLVGVITVDDVIDVIKDETTETILKIGGVETLEEPYTRTPFWSLVKKRGRWLLVLFLGEMLTATAMGYFEEELKRGIVLALFIPLIISSGGNSGSQAASLIIRALAVGEVTVRDWWRVIRREILSGLALGTILGTVGLIRVIVAALLFHNVYGPHWLLVGVVVALALLGVVLWGTITGSMLPFIMKRIGADPAVSSAPFVATLVDVTGLVIYFTVAAVILKGALL